MAASRLGMSIATFMRAEAHSVAPRWVDALRTSRGCKSLGRDGSHSIGRGSSAELCKFLHKVSQTLQNSQIANQALLLKLSCVLHKNFAIIFASAPQFRHKIGPKLPNSAQGGPMLEIRWTKHTGVAHVPSWDDAGAHIRKFLTPTQARSAPSDNRALAIIAARYGFFVGGQEDRHDPS